MSEKKVNLAIIGCGGMAGAHLNSYKELKEKGLDNFELLAMCDVVEDRAKSFSERAREFQEEAPSVYTSLEEMLEKEELDAADICSPHSYHHLNAIPCLEAGIDVMIEKPFSVTIKAGKKIIETAEKNKRIVATAENHRKGLEQRTIWWVINERKIIGEPRMFFSESVGLSLGIYGGTPWRHSKLISGGSIVIDGGVHYTDFLRYLFGDVKKVYATVRRFEPIRYQDPSKKAGAFQSTVEDTSIATLTFETGLVGVWTLSQAGVGRGFGQTIYYGSEGSLDGGGVQLKDGTQKKMQELQELFMQNITAEQKEKLFPNGITNGVTIEVYDFIKAVLNRSRPDVDGLDGLKALAICEAIYESSLCGQAVQMKEVLEGKVEGYQKEINEYWGI